MYIIFILFKLVTLYYDPVNDISLHLFNGLPHDEYNEASIWVSKAGKILMQPKLANEVAEVWQLSILRLLLYGSTLTLHLPKTRFEHEISTDMILSHPHRILKSN